MVGKRKWTAVNSQHCADTTIHPDLLLQAVCIFNNVTLFPPLLPTDKSHNSHAFKNLSHGILNRCAVLSYILYNDISRYQCSSWKHFPGHTKGFCTKLLNLGHLFLLLGSSKPSFSLEFELGTVLAHDDTKLVSVATLNTHGLCSLFSEKRWWGKINDFTWFHTLFILKIKRLLSHPCRLLPHKNVIYWTFVGKLK